MVLDQAAALMNKVQNVQLVVKGYTDATGNAVANTLEGNTEEDAYWRDNYATTSYYAQGYDYDTDYRSAYDYGYRARHHFNDANDFDSVENELRQDWAQFKGQSRLSWDQARLAARDAWYRIER